MLENVSFQEAITLWRSWPERLAAISLAYTSGMSDAGIHEAGRYCRELMITRDRVSGVMWPAVQVEFPVGPTAESIADSEVTLSLLEGITATATQVNPC